jgi:hypothetical protein
METFLLTGKSPSKQKSFFTLKTAFKVLFKGFLFFG